MKVKKGHKGNAEAGPTVHTLFPSYPMLDNFVLRQEFR